jgi:hypothetical protein
MFSADDNLLGERNEFLKKMEVLLVGSGISTGVCNFIVLSESKE